MTVPSQQPSSSPCKLALVGEAPGADEIREGRPFVGQSGRVINAAMAAAGIERHEVYLGNVFQEKADDNNVEPWLRDPARMAEAVARLNQELAAVEPTVIVPLGGAALRALTGYTEISRMRGSPTISPGPVMVGSKVLPTFHPAFILRQWKMFPVLIDDLMRAVAEADIGPAIVYPHKEFTLEPDLGEIQLWVHGYKDEAERGWLLNKRGQLFSSLLDTDIISADIETGWGQITCISFAPDDAHAICIPFVDLRRPSKSYWANPLDEITAWGYVKEILECPVPKLGQNFTYDAWWLLDQMGIRPRNYRYDTRLEHHALMPELPKDLSFMATAYTQANWKHWSHGKEMKRDA